MNEVKPGYKFRAKEDSPVIIQLKGKVWTAKERLQNDAWTVEEQDVLYSCAGMTCLTLDNDYLYEPVQETNVLYKAKLENDISGKPYNGHNKYTMYSIDNVWRASAHLPPGTVVEVLKENLSLKKRNNVKYCKIRSEDGNVGYVEQILLTKIDDTTVEETKTEAVELPTLSATKTRAAKAIGDDAKVVKEVEGLSKFKKAVEDELTALRKENTELRQKIDKDVKGRQEEISNIKNAVSKKASTTSTIETHRIAQDAYDNVDLAGTMGLANSIAIILFVIVPFIWSGCTSDSEPETNDTTEEQALEEVDENPEIVALRKENEKDARLTHTANTEADREEINDRIKARLKRIGELTNAEVVTETEGSPSEAGGLGHGDGSPVGSGEPEESSSDRSWFRGWGSSTMG